MKNKINIGTASIVLIFIVLCLSVFSLLSLSDARSAQVFSQRRADSVTAYYQTDRKGQEFIRAVTQALKNKETQKKALEEAERSLAAILPEESMIYESDGDLVCEIAMTAGQALFVKVSGEDAGVLDYYIYNSEDYAIDNRLPVWGGE